VNNNELPIIDLLSAITTKHDESNRLLYPNLKIAVDLQTPFVAQRERELAALQTGSLVWLHAHYKLTQVYIKKTALEYVTAPAAKKSKLAIKFTHLSAQLYGKPDAATLHNLIKSELADLRELQDKVHPANIPDWERVIEVYSALLTDDARMPETDHSLAAAAMCEHLQTHYKKVFKVVKSRRKLIDPLQLKKIFVRAIKQLAKADSDWKKWQVVLVDTSIVSVDGDKKTIRIGSRRSKLERVELAPLLAHELLVHAQRCINAQKIDDEILRSPLAGYEQAEEGLGVYVEWIFSGTLPQKMKDRYIDIALALGMNKKFGRFKRTELFEFALQRAQVRASANEENITPAQLMKKVWTHVDRIFRGTPGDDSEGVFTRDTVYYAGFIKMRRYISRQYRAGRSAPRIWRYLSAAKFDPTNHIHVDYLNEKTGKNLDF